MTPHIIVPGERASSPEAMRALVAAIDVNDHIDLDAVLPPGITIDYPAERFVDGFVLSHQLWREGFDRGALIALAGQLRAGGTLDEVGRVWFKQVRARFKHLRFAFFLYTARHRSPAMLSLVTLVMGELQDATRFGALRDVRRHAGRLQLLLSAPTWRLLPRQVQTWQRTSAEGFRRFTLQQIASFTPIIDAQNVGAHSFHAARKVVSRQVSFHDDMRVLYPSEEHRQMSRWLATLNGLMGRLHDELVARNAAGTFDYRRDALALPGDIRARLEALVMLYRGTSSSTPSDS